MLNSLHSIKSSTPYFRSSSAANSTAPNNEKTSSDKTSKSQVKPLSNSSMNKLQIASLAIGTIASTALIAYFAKDLGIFGKNRGLLKKIKKGNFPENVRKKMLLEYEKSKTADGAGSVNYINNILRLNWNKPESKIIDVDNAKAILDREIVGLDSIKDEILSHIIKVNNYKARMIGIVPIEFVTLHFHRF